MAANSAAAQQKHHDIIIVGAGVVGATLSTALARAGRRVLVLERDLSEPDRIVGELLQPGGVRALQLLGLADTLEGIDAVPTEGYHIFLNPNESVKIQYPAVPELPSMYGRTEPLGRDMHYEGRSFHHGKFIMALRKRMLAEPNVTAVQATVTDLRHDRNARVVGVDTSEGTFYAPVTVAADGIFSKFRKTYGGAYKPEVRSYFVGLELPTSALLSPRHGHVILNQQAAKDAVPGKAVGPALVYQIGSDEVRLLVDVPGRRLPSSSNGELQDYLRHQVAPCLPKPVGDALHQVMEKGERMRVMPNSFLPPSMQGTLKHQRGMILVGDAMNMRHPLTGGGMTVAFWDCVYLTHILGTGAWSPLDDFDTSFPISSAARDLTQWPALQQALRTWHWKRKKLASVINILAMSLYSLFGVPDDHLTLLRAGCFRYFERGGDCVRGPISLLAGLAPDPLLLVYHFFAVAVYSVLLMFRGTLLVPADSKKKVTRPPIYAWPMLAVQAMVVLFYACFVIFPVIFTELRANTAPCAHSLRFQSLALLCAGTAGLAASLWVLL
ncbi:squalene monooxygenase [Malassezia nana]|uniref:Squalene monooxygenase n=1 Tax=Malassezia nana TaxID=180528 RepID=A0AAF0EJR1_9BASI|nr:squalene monooxygenase [Malassezia nana]